MQPGKTQVVGLVRALESCENTLWSNTDIESAKNIGTIGCSIPTESWYESNR